MEIRRINIQVDSEIKKKIILIAEKYNWTQRVVVQKAILSLIEELELGFCPECGCLLDDDEIDVCTPCLRVLEKEFQAIKETEKNLDLNHRY